MERRDFVKVVGAVSAHAFFPAVLSSFLSSCESENEETYRFLFFDKQEQVVIKELVDILIPKTSTKSASEVNAHHFLDQIFSLCLEKEKQDQIHKGLQNISSEWGVDKVNYIVVFDKKAFAEEGYDFFKLIKHYTMVGFYTSQEGTTKAANYGKFPGDYKGEIALKKSTLNYGKTDLKYYM